MRTLKKINEFEQTRPVSESDRRLVHKMFSGPRRSLASLAKSDARSTAKNPISKMFLTRMQVKDDFLRAACICAECGGKALYWMVGKKYCKAHIEIGKAAYRKKWGMK